MSSSTEGSGSGPQDAAAEDSLGIGAGEDILVVDDNEANLVAFESALEPLGRKVVIVQSGVEALAKMLSQDFALVILDVSMPGMGGFECAEMIRQRRRSRGIPIIFVTGLSVQDTAVLAGYEVGGYDFLVKPIRAEVLRAKVRVFLKLQERTREMQRHAEAARRLEAEAHASEMRAQQQRHESELLAMRVQQLAELDRRKDELLAILGHQLRNPLQALQLAIDMLQGLPDPPRYVVSRLHQVIDQRVRSLGQLVDDLLDIARLSSGEIVLQAKPVRLADVVHRSVAAVESSLDGRTIETGLDDTLVVSGDATRLARCVASLLDNAIKYTQPGGHIKIDLTSDRGRAVLRVTDDGCGVAPKLLPRIFDVFAHADGEAGLGLGLAIVRRLVEVHGGKVRAASGGEGRGARFEIDLPLAPTTTPQVDDDDLRPTRPLRVVVCEDAHDIRELAAEVLRADGHTVYQAGDGAQAIELIESERPDVALVDLILPDIDGSTVARTVRDRLGSLAPRLIAITARVTAPQPEFDEHLLKPASRERMLSALARVSR